MNKHCNYFGHKYNPVLTSRYSQKVHRCIREKCEEYLVPDEDFEKNSKEHRWDGTYWESSDWELIRMILSVLFWATMVIFFIIFVGAVIDNLTCDSYQNLGIPAKWGLWTGCMAEHPKFGWIPISEYFRVINLNIP